MISSQPVPSKIIGKLVAEQEWQIICRWVKTRNAIVLILPDLSTAFDIVDRAILLNTLRKWGGLGAAAINWFSSYLSDRVFRVTKDNCTSSTALMSCGVTQGSVLGLILFSLYLFPHGHVICHISSVSYHGYADDSQIICFVSPSTQP